VVQLLLIYGPFYKKRDNSQTTSNKMISETTDLKGEKLKREV